MNAPTVAVLPARGGSRRIPRKNIRPLRGRPLIEWTIGVALTSGLFDQIVVSTDDEEIASVARSSGATTPFTRPAALADDHTGTQPVITHAIGALGLPDAALVCCLYPAAALLSPEDLRQSHALAHRLGGNRAVASIVSFGHPVARALVRDTGGFLTWADPAAAPRRTQDLPALVHDAGQFYWARADRWQSAESLLTGAMGFPLPSWRAVDIDSEEDWRHVELLAAGLAAVS